MEERPYSSILVEQQGRVVTLTLNRPERRNPLSPAMVNELLWALDDVRDDDGVRVVVLTGAGKAFSAGGDLKQMAEDGGGGFDPKGDYVDLLLRFPKLGKPTIARVAGPALGGGLGLVACCDFAVGAESAVLGTPEIKVGLFPMMITAVLRDLVPRRKLLAMMLLGEKLSAHEALDHGLLSSVVADEALDETVATLAETLSAQSPTAMRMGLHAYHHQSKLSPEEALPYLRSRLFALLETEDATEGLAAFAEKRAPRWKGP